MTTPTTHGTPANTTGPAPVLIRLGDVLARTGIPQSTLYARMKAVTFPLCVKLSARSVAWVAAEIDAWIDARMAERPAPLAA